MFLPTHEPQSPAPGEPSGLSKWAFNKTDGSVSCESIEDSLSLYKRKKIMAFAKKLQVKQSALLSPTPKMQVMVNCLLKCKTYIDLDI